MNIAGLKGNWETNGFSYARTRPHGSGNRGLTKVEKVYAIAGEMKGMRLERGCLDYFSLVAFYTSNYI